MIVLVGWGCLESEFEFKEGVGYVGYVGKGHGLWGCIIVIDRTSVGEEIRRLGLGKGRVFVWGFLSAVDDMDGVDFSKSESEVYFCRIFLNAMNDEFDGYKWCGSFEWWKWIALDIRRDTPFRRPLATQMTGALSQKNALLSSMQACKEFEFFWWLV